MPRLNRPPPVERPPPSTRIGTRKLSSVEQLLETHHASRPEIAAKQGPNLGMIVDDVQRAILDPVAQGTTPPIHIPFFRSRDLVSVPFPLTSRSNWAKDSSTLRVNRPMLVVVEELGHQTKETPSASNVSTSLAKSASERVSRSTL